MTPTISLGMIWLILILIKLFGGFKDLNWSTILLLPILRIVLRMVIILGLIYLFMLGYHFLIEVDIFNLGDDFWTVNITGR